VDLTVISACGRVSGVNEVSHHLAILPCSLLFVRGSTSEDMARNSQHFSIIPTKRTPGHIQMHDSKKDTGTLAQTMQVAGAQVVIIAVLLLFITVKHEAMTCRPRDTKPPTLISSSCDRR
jgi:hypothetical protein